MSKLIALSGLPGSGKSYWAKAQVANDLQGTVRVNRDDLRTMIHDGRHVKGVTEELIILAEESLAYAFLEEGFTVIVDDTNLTQRHLNSWKAVADFMHAEFEVKVFDTDIEECIARDAARPNPVGDAVIRNLAKRRDVT